MATDAVSYENWMTNLPSALHKLPLCHLAVPGSHNSFAYWLDIKGGLSPDAPNGLQGLVQVFGDFAKGIVHTWSVTQSLNVAEQLNAGIRYFDIRLGARPGDGELLAVHGLYGSAINSCLDALTEFLNAHPHEVVLLDFNHFYSVDSAAHDVFVNSLIQRFSSKMCPVSDEQSLTLQSLWDAGHQLIVFYHDDESCRKHRQLWPAASIHAYWHNTQDVNKLVAGVNKVLQDRPKGFYLTQGILTPDAGFIMAHFGQSLLSAMSGAVLRPFVEWLSGQRAGSNGVNVVSVDFVELNQIIPLTIGLNYTLSQQFE